MEKNNLKRVTKLKLVFLKAQESSQTLSRVPWTTERRLSRQSQWKRGGIVTVGEVNTVYKKMSNCVLTGCTA